VAEVLLFRKDNVAKKQATMKLRDRFITQFNQIMAGMDNRTRIQWVQVIFLFLTTAVWFTLLYYYTEKPEIILPSIVAMICASIVFPAYLFYIIRNELNLSEDELRKLRSLYNRIIVYCIGTVIFFFLLAILMRVGAHWSKNVDSCDVTVPFFKFNIC
jgi:hypothetical protein